MKIKLSEERCLTIWVEHGASPLSPPEKEGERYKLSTLPYTDVYVTLNNGHTFLGSSYCRPPDTFSKKRGFRIALKRALSSLCLSKEDRRFVWGTFGISSPKTKKRRKKHGSQCQSGRAAVTS